MCREFQVQVSSAAKRVHQCRYIITSQQPNGSAVKPLVATLLSVSTWTHRPDRFGPLWFRKLLEFHKDKSGNFRQFKWSKKIRMRIQQKWVSNRNVISFDIAHSDVSFGLKCSQVLSCLKIWRLGPMVFHALWTLPWHVATVDKWEKPAWPKITEKSNETKEILDPWGILDSVSSICCLWGLMWKTINGVVWLMFYDRHTLRSFKIDATSVNWRHHWCIKVKTIRKWAGNKKVSRFKEHQSPSICSRNKKMYFPCGCRLWVRSLRAAARAASGQMKRETSMLCFGKTAWRFTLYYIIW